MVPWLLFPVHCRATVVGWGNNAYNQLPGNTVGNTVKPVSAQVLYSDWTKLEAGDHHVCGLRPGGQLYCWGRNNKGQVRLAIFCKPVLSSTASWLHPLTVYTASSIYMDSVLLFCAAGRWHNNRQFCTKAGAGHLARFRRRP